MKGYKIFDENLQCRGFQYAVGKTYTHKKEIKFCESGFHFCQNPVHLFNYYSFDPSNRVCEVEALGYSILHGDDKSVCKKIKIIRELSWEDVLKLVNLGIGNSGYYNSGYSNSGYYNSGNYNSGHSNSGFFNTDEPTVRMFNKDTGLKRSEIDIPFIELKITEWIPESAMTEEQKRSDPNFSVKGGTLIRRTYHEAWKKAWGELCEANKQRFLDLPNFDANIFEEITGIQTCQKDVNCDRKEVLIDGKKYKLVEIKEI